MINARELEPEGCTCSHCWCDCKVCEPVTDWYLIPGGWVSDRNIMFREDLIDGFENRPTPIPMPKGIAAMLEAEPADKITQAHFAGRYLDAIEAEGLRIVPATDTVTEREWDGESKNRFHLIMQGTERVGFLTPLRYPDRTVRSRTPKATA